MQEEGERYDDGAATAPISREAPFAAQEQQSGVSQPGYDPAYMPPPRYGFGPAMYGRRRGGWSGGPIETRPFFVTSEFIGTLLAIVALGATAGAMDILDARLTWILTAGLVGAYVVSRGIAKAGSRSHALDPREGLLARGVGAPHEQTQQTQAPAQTMPPPSTYGYGMRPYGRRTGAYPIETMPFFVTSEFVATLLGVVSVALTSAAMDALGARLTWILIASMVGTYALSRGLAKAGTRSHAFDPRERLLGDDSVTGTAETAATGAPIGIRGVETKPFFLTSEFIATVLAIVALAISAATIDILDVRLAWILIAAMISGYVLSRGLAKIGSASHALDPREYLLERAVGDSRPERQPIRQR